MNDGIKELRAQKELFYEHKLREFEMLPEEAMAVIERYESANEAEQANGYNELEVTLSVRSRCAEESLLYALTSGTAYVIQNGSIYIWYKPFQKMEGSGFFKLKRYVLFYGGNMVKYILDGNEKLSDSL